MGMIDNNLVFCEAQAVTTQTDNASTNSLDLGGSTLGDAGQTQENLWVQALCSTTAASGGSATVTAVLQSSADNATNWTDAVASKAWPVASVTAGTVLLQVQPPPGMMRYWRIVWRIGAAALTAGKFDAFIANTIQRNVAQAAGFAVS